MSVDAPPELDDVTPVARMLYWFLRVAGPTRMCDLYDRTPGFTQSVYDAARQLRLVGLAAEAYDTAETDQKWVWLPAYHKTPVPVEGDLDAPEGQS